MPFTERSARAGLEVLLKSQSAFFRFEGNIELEFPRAKFGGVARDVGLMLFDSVPELGRITNVVVSRSGYRFEDVNVVHGAGPPSSGYGRTTARRFRPLGLSLPNVLSELRAAPRCSPRGTSGRWGVRGRTSSEHIGLLLGEMAFTERSARAGLEVLLKSQSAFFRFEGNIQLEFPRAKFGSVAGNVGLMLLDSVPELGRMTNVVVSRSGYLFEDVNVVHGAGPPSSRLRPDYGATLSPFGFRVCQIC